jgi:hypothetical protein
MVTADKNGIESQPEIFLLLPENRRILLGESRKLGVKGEDESLRRAIWVLGIAILIFNIITLGPIITSIQADSKSTDFQFSLVILQFAINILVLGYPWLRILKRYRNKRMLEQEGILIYGKVFSARTDRAITFQGTKTALRLKYRFLSPTGKQLVKEEAQLWIRSESSAIPAAGTPVAILYIDDNCFRVL